MDIMQNLESKLTDRQRRNRDKTGRIWSRKEIESAFIETFDLVGGIPRLALWANDPENYGDFLKLLTRFAPKQEIEQMGQVLQYRSNVPHSPLSDRFLPKIDEGELVDEDQP